MLNKIIKIFSTSNKKFLSIRKRARIRSMIFTPERVEFSILRSGQLCAQTFTAKEIIKNSSLRNCFSSTDLLKIFFQFMDDDKQKK